ncbi:hypothetical protein [Halorubellus sp. PRR65]|uniref:hypothetical protein n=1 Tax=Halorubellus sp. PRR65 TaxID=3098148 RepID=UPI002B261FFA|nr:hypothetical protein [Halorubellus sp. PRR65]
MTDDAHSSAADAHPAAEVAHTPGTDRRSTGAPDGERGGSRRAFLSALGATTATGGLAALAGCSMVPNDDSEDVSFHASELPDVDDDPVVALGATYPMPVPRSHRRDAQTRANDALEDVPTPLGARRVPNGHVRQHLADAVTEARDHLDAALRAPTPRETLQSLRRARSRARYASAGWDAIEDGHTVAALEDEATDVTERAADARDAMTYVGTDRAPAVVVHASRERLLDAAESVSDDASHEDVRVLRVAEYAEHVERATASLADATTIAARFRDRQPDDAEPLQSPIETARDSLREDLQSALDDLPGEADADSVGDADIENTLTQRVLYELYYDASDEGPATSPYGPASAVLSGVRQLAAIRAYRTVRDRVASGRRYEITGADTVREAYTATHEALAAAPRRSDAPGLARAALQYTASVVRFADERLAERSGELHAHDVNDSCERYVVHGAIAEATPEAVDTALAALDAN